MDFKIDFNQIAKNLGDEPVGRQSQVSEKASSTDTFNFNISGLSDKNSKPSLVESILPIPQYADRTGNVMDIGSDLAQLIREEVRAAIKEELRDKVVLQEGNAETIYLQIGETTFKAVLTPVKRG